jgi:hypothetical protein
VADESNDEQQDITEAVMEVIRERLQLRIQEGDSFWWHNTEGYIELELVIVDPGNYSAEPEVLSSVTIDGGMLGHIRGTD